MNLRIMDARQTHNPRRYAFHRLGRYSRRANFRVRSKLLNAAERCRQNSLNHNGVATYLNLAQDPRAECNIMRSIAAPGDTSYCPNNRFGVGMTLSRFIKKDAI